ncbi:MAG: thioesterase family protein [Gammaproteobacteria bacterium]|nr:thioesterase family protein [Gammaproteobacteria bacterium]MDH5693006.1 thioesterase family protein [Gammaproteobacteria bacterium]
MSLIFRMVWILVRSLFVPRLPYVKPVNALTLRVLPNDLDINLHMNNGRYFTICDLTRVDMFIRTGLAKVMIQKKWIPVISYHDLNFKKALGLFKRYRVEMEVTGWDEKAFFMSHRFLVGDKIVAEGESKGVILSKKGPIPPEEVMQAVREMRGE